MFNRIRGVNAGCRDLVGAEQKTAGEMYVSSPPPLYQSRNTKMAEAAEFVNTNITTEVVRRPRLLALGGLGN